MKTIVLLFFTCLLSLAVHAAAPTPAPAPTFAQIKLATGEVLKDVKFLSQTPTHVTFKTAGGMRQIDKRQLPAELQTQFPYDEEAAERRKAALAEADAKRAAERETKKAAVAAAAANPDAKGAKPDLHVRNGVRLTFQSDPEGSGPIITLVNDSNVDQAFAKTEIGARMMDDRVSVLRTASRGDKLEVGGQIIVVGDILNVKAHDRLEFRGYFLSNYREVKHTVMDVFWIPQK